VLAAAALGALAVIAGLTLLMRRDPRAFPLLAVVALPFRLPISAEGRTVNLLLPLYAVVAAGVLAHLLPRLLRREGGYRSGRPPMALDWLLGASVALYTLQIALLGRPGQGSGEPPVLLPPFWVALRAVA